MIKSMTGYGYAENTVSGKRIVAEIRAVNHRYLDLNIKTQRSYAFLEETIRKILGGFIARGKIDVFVNIENLDNRVEISLDRATAKGYLAALNELKAELALEGEVDISTLSRLGDIFRVDKAKVNQEEIIPLAAEVVHAAVEGFAAMRAREGESLAADLTGQFFALRALVDEIEARAPLIVGDYEKRLAEKVSELLGDVQIDEGRLLNEVVIFADKINTNEEIIRLKSHIEQGFEIVKSQEPAGRKLDFIIQELNREINTIGSKSSDLTSIKLVMEAKAVIEKMREQAQNIE